MNQPPRYSADEFRRESQYIDNLIWDALVVEPGTRVLFCGFSEDARWVRRALAAGAEASVVEHRESEIRRYESIGATLLQGSTSFIPARPDSFDLAIAFHYLHEADPFFHAQIVSELSRVARRVAIVEPGPPADALGKKIASLYSQAKRELGQFEYYQPLEYWRKLLRATKAEISQHVFAFAKIPPLEYLRDTIELLLTTLEVEDAPKTDLDELRAIARRSDSLVLPPARYVICGAAAGDLPQPIFTPREEPTPTPPLAKAAQSNEPVPEVPRTVTREAGYEFPPIEPPPAPKPIPSPASPADPPPAAAPAAPTLAPPPFGSPFAMPGVEPPPNPFGIPPMPGMAPGWQWEPPEEPK